MRCPKCGHEIDHLTGKCCRCGFMPWGISRDPEKETATTKAELALIRLRNSLRIFSNRVSTFEHKGLLAVLLLAVIGIILLTAVSSCLRG